MADQTIPPKRQWPVGRIALMLAQAVLGIAFVLFARPIMLFGAWMAESAPQGFAGPLAVVACALMISAWWK